MSNKQKGKTSSLTEQLAFRVHPKTRATLLGVAAAYRVSYGELLRWMCEDACAGKWQPAHLKGLR